MRFSGCDDRHLRWEWTLCAEQHHQPGGRILVNAHHSRTGVPKTRLPMSAKLLKTGGRHSQLLRSVMECFKNRAFPWSPSYPIRSHQARLQAQQTVTPRPHSCGMRGFCLAVLVGETGSDKQRSRLIKGSNGAAVGERKETSRTQRIEWPFRMAGNTVGLYSDIRRLVIRHFIALIV